MSLMSGLFVGASGLQTSQNSLHTTAHNLSNIETPGYVRQQTLHADVSYNNIKNSAVSKMQIGLGVEYDTVRQVRDDFLDKSYRKETGRSNFYEVCQETTTEIETLLGEFDGVAFQDSIADLWTSVQELQKDPLSAVTKGYFINTSTQFLERAQAVYNGLSAYQDNLNARVNEYVDRINELGDQIYSLNEAIHKEEIGVQEANDLRDRRNKALDELSGLAKISYSTNADGGIEVELEGVPFVVRDRVFHIDTIAEEGTGFYTPVWPQNMNAEVFARNEVIATDYNTDIGQLKSVILGRGDRRANYTDMSYDTYMNGKYTYHDDITGTDVKQDLIPTSKSIVMKVQAELDQMVHSLMTEVNNILTGEKDAIAAYNASDPKDPSLLPKYEEGETLPKELFVRLGTSRYEKIDDGGTTYYRYVPENDKPSHTVIDLLYTVSNMKINPDLQKTPSLLGQAAGSEKDEPGFMTLQGEVDHAKADALAEAFMKPFSSLSPDLTIQYGYRDYYAAMVGQVATEGSVYSSIVSAQQIATHNLSDSRDAIMGVSSNEELTNMIKYQNAYNAASRYITACNDMLERLLSSLG